MITSDLKFENPPQIDVIQSKICIVRNRTVILDRDLAMLYQVETKQLTRQVRRNLERFPSDFMFELTKEEHDLLRCQIGTLKQRGKHSKYLPLAFTQEGIAMLSGLLRSPIAIQVNINIMRAFVSMRKTLAILSKQELSMVQLHNSINQLNRLVDDILRDQNDINEMQERVNQDVYNQIDVINFMLSELQNKIETSLPLPLGKPIGFRIEKEEK